MVKVQLKARGKNCFLEMGFIFMGLGHVILFLYIYFLFLDCKKQRGAEEKQTGESI